MAPIYSKNERVAKMAKITIRVDPRTGGSYFPKEIRRAGFIGKIEGFLNALTCTLVKPGATLNALNLHRQPD